MIKKIGTIVILLILAAFFTACGGDDGGTVVSEIVLTYSITPDDEHEIRITDPQIINDIVSLLDTIEYEPTSQPMGFPRFQIQYYSYSEEAGDSGEEEDDAEESEESAEIKLELIAHWYIGENDVVSGSELQSEERGVHGNNILTSGSVYPDIWDIYDIIVSNDNAGDGEIDGGTGGNTGTGSRNIYDYVISPSP